VKFAVTLLLALTTTRHLSEVTLSHPLQPENVDPDAGAAVSCTGGPLVYDSLQSLPHEMPLGMLVTLPFPEPLFVTVKFVLLQDPRW
jgi:hypothetical protein